MKTIFYVTFGQRSPFKDGWVEILASDRDAAHDEALSLFGQHFSGLYEADQFNNPDTKAMYPDGRFGRVIEGL